MRIPNKFINISFLSGILIILLVIWNRFIRVRLPKDLIPLENLNIYFYSILLTTILFLMLMVYSVLQFLKYIPREDSKITVLIHRLLQYFNQYPIFNFIYKVITQDIPNGPITVYTLFYKYIYIKPIIEYIGNILYNNLFEKQLRIKTIYTIVFVIPRMITVMIFLIEVIVFKHLHYFYLSLTLLIIPLISKLSIYIIKHHATHRIDYYENFFKFQLIDSVLHITIKNLPKDNIEDNIRQKALEQDFEGLSNWWYFYQRLYNISYQLLDLQLNSYKDLLNSIYYGLFFIGFLCYALILLGIL